MQHPHLNQAFNLSTITFIILPQFPRSPTHPNTTTSSPIHSHPSFLPLINKFDHSFDTLLFLHQFRHHTGISIRDSPPNLTSVPPDNNPVLPRSPFNLYLSISSSSLLIPSQTSFLHLHFLHSALSHVTLGILHPILSLYSLSRLAFPPSFPHPQPFWLCSVHPLFPLPSNSSIPFLLSSASSSPSPSF